MSIDTWSVEDQQIQRRPRPFPYPSFTTLVVILAHERVDRLKQQIANVLEYVPDCFIAVNWNSADPIDETDLGSDRVEINDCNIKVGRFNRTFVDAATYWTVTHPSVQYQSVLFLSSTTLLFEPVPVHYLDGTTVAMGVYQQPDSIMDCMVKHPMYLHIGHTYPEKHIYWWLPTRIPFYNKFMRDNRITIACRGQFSGSIYPRDIVMTVGEWLAANASISASGSPFEEILFQTIVCKDTRRYRIVHPIVYIHWTNVTNVRGRYECKVAEAFEYAYQLAYGICRIDPGPEGEIARKLLEYRWIWRHLSEDQRQMLDIENYKKYLTTAEHMMRHENEMEHNGQVFYRWIAEFPYYVNEDEQAIICCIHPPSRLYGSYY
jgi:hypothetical protein